MRTKLKFFFLAALLATSLVVPSPTLAQDVPPACLSLGPRNGCGSQGCGDESICVHNPGIPVCFCQRSTSTNADNPFGTIDSPVSYGGTAPGSGLIILFNNVLRLLFTGAGIFAFLKIVLSGLGFINAGGDPKKIESAWAGIWQALMGVAIIISSFAVAVLAGYVLLGDATAILNPKIYAPGT